MINGKWLLTILFFSILITLLVEGIRTNITAQLSGHSQQMLTMVTSSEYPPYQYRDLVTGKDEIIGFNVDIAKYITKQLGYGLEVIDTEAIIPALQSRRADFSVAGMVPTVERKKYVEFSDIYFEAKNTIISREASHIKTSNDLIGKKVGVPLGTIQEKQARKFPGIILEVRNKTVEIIEEIKANHLDAGIVEEPVAQGYITNNSNLEYHIIPNTEKLGYAIAFPKDSNLVISFNQVLRQMKGNGEIARLTEKWFKRTNDNTSKTSFAFVKIVPTIPYIIRGILVTLEFTLISALFGFIWGTILSLLKISTIKPLVWFGTAYTSVFRGTPLLLQIALVYYATPQLTGYNISALLAGVITFTLNSGAYISETIRAGILAVDRGQKEAALSLGISYTSMMWDIILPQALKNILPALVNESIGLLKASALVSTIGVQDLLRRAQIVGAQKYIFFEPLIVASAIYYLMIMILTWSGYVLDKRLQRSN